MLFIYIDFHKKNGEERADIDKSMNIYISSSMLMYYISNNNIINNNNNNIT